ncbi:MAG: hypothetical protein P9M15_04965 [Candidatus Electryoneaceae bacterium]|nr:hypothetical protein [Candidatus Electryoneaceae bacterium]
MKIPKNLPRPMFIRPNDYVTVLGADYIIKRNEFAQMIKVIGRVSRKLPSLKDVTWALQAGRQVAYWGNKYFMWERIDKEVLPEIEEMIWEADKRRGVEPPIREELIDSIFDM